MGDLVLTTYDRVPPPPRGFVRDIRVRWALEEANLPYRVESVSFEERGPEHFAHQPYGADEVKRQEKLVADAIAERGVHTGAELRWLRKQSGLAAKELASLLDVTAETVSKWENDRRPITRLAAFAVNQLYRHPRKARQLLGASGAPAV